MPDPDHERWLGMAAMSAVGMLPPAESAEFTDHVESCQRCRREVEELRSIAQSLSNLPIGDAVPEPSAALEERVVWGVRGARRSERRHQRIVTSVAAAAAAIAFLAVGVTIGTPTSPPQEALQVATASSAVDAQASLVAHTWGTEVKLVVSGLDADEKYRVTFVDREGQRVPAGTFIGVNDRPIVCDMNAAVMRPDARRLEVASRDGQVVLAADLPRPPAAP